MLNAVEELCQETREMDADRLFHTAQNPGIERFWIWNPNRDLGFLPTCWRGIHFLGEKSVHAGGRSKAEVAWKGLLCPRTYRKRKKRMISELHGQMGSELMRERLCEVVRTRSLWVLCHRSVFIIIIILFECKHNTVFPHWNVFLIIICYHPAFGFPSNMERLTQCTG